MELLFVNSDSRSEMAALFLDAEYPMNRLGISWAAKVVEGSVGTIWARR